MPNATTVTVLDAFDDPQVVSTIDNTIGTAGSASTQVQTVQGIASMTPILATLSGTNNINNIGGTVTLPTGASTAAKQPALGTAGSASTDVITIQGIASMTKLLVTPDANSSVNLAQVAGGSTATGHGTASGSLRVELPTDGTGVIASVTQSPDTRQATAANLNAQVVGNVGSGATDSGKPVKVGGIYNASPITLTDGQRGDIQLDASGYLKVNVTNGASGGTSSVDDSAFTAGSGSGTPMMGFASTDAVDVDDVGVLGMDVNRRLKITANSGSILSGAVASGAFASGSIASGAIASGAVASGAFASGALASGSIAAGAIAAGATSIAENEDVASADGDRGVKVLWKRTDTPANASGTDGDYEQPQMSAGRLWVSAKIDTALPAGTNAIGKLASNTGVTIGAVEIAAAQTLATVTTVSTVSTVTGGGVASGATDSGNPIKVGGKYNSTPITLTDGQRGDIQLDASGFQKVNIAAGTVSITANSSVNLAQVGGASTATAASGTQKVGIVGNAAATLDSTVGAGTAPTNALVTGAIYNSTEISPTNGQAFAVQADSKGRIRNVIMDGAGNTRAANVSAAATAPLIADTALVTNISPNNTGLPVNLPVQVQATNNKSTGSVASLAKAFVSNNVAGNSIVVVCGVGNGTAPTITDTNSNTYVQVAQVANSTTLNVAIFLATGILVGANTVTVNNGGSAASIAMQIYEYSGFLAKTNAASQPSVSATNTGTSATAATTAIAPLSPNEIAFAAVGIGTAPQTITVGSGWTNDSGQQNPTTPAGLQSFISMSQVLSCLGAVTPQATFTSEPWGIAVASFRPVVVGVEGSMNVQQIGGAAVSTAASGVQKVGIVGATGTTLDGTAGSAASGVLSVQGIASMTPVQVTGTGTAGSAATGVVTIQGIASMTKLLVTPDANSAVNVAQLAGTTTDTNSGSKSAGTLRVVIATDQPQLTNKLLVTPDANSAINLAQVGGTNTVTGGVNGSQSVGGPTASGSSIAANPLTQGGRAATANPTAVSDGQVVNTMHDKLGKLVAVGALRDLKGVTQTSISNSTSETTIVAAVASTFLDIYGLVFANTGATTTKVTVKDSTAGTTRMVFEVPTLETRGFMVSVDSAVPQATVNNNWTATCASATTAMEVTALWVKNT